MLIRPQKQRHAGFTLVELLITVAIAAVLAAMAVPNLSDIINRNRMRQATSDLTTALALARSEAVLRQKSVVICSSNFETSEDFLMHGWVVVQAKNCQEAKSLSSSGAEASVLRVFEPNAQVGATMEPGGWEVVFLSSGGLAKGEGKTIKLDVSAKVKRDVQVGASGRVRVRCPSDVSANCS